MACALTTPLAWAEDSFFDLNSLEISEDEKRNLASDLRMSAGKQIPGSYPVNIYVNRKFVTHQNVVFIQQDEQFIPQITKPLLQEMRLRTHTLPGLKHLADDQPVSDITKVLPGTRVEADVLSGRLNITVPADYLLPKGETLPQEWDHGLPMVFTNINASGYQTQRQNGRDSENQYVNLTNGVNLGAWRLRNKSYYQKTAYSAAFTSDKTWVSRDIQSLLSRFSAGETETTGLVIESIRFIGASLESISAMQSSRDNGFGPQIQGTALSNATVQVSQNNRMIYQTFVPPGDFFLRDVSVSNAGELDVSVTEEDGTVRTFTVPVSTSATLLRPGNMKYSLSIGQHDNDTDTWSDGSSRNVTHRDARKRFVQGELIYGANNTATVLSGALMSEDYQHAALGMGLNLGNLGSLTPIAGGAKSVLADGSDKQGYFTQLTYQKYLTPTQTYLSLSRANYTRDFYTFDDINQYSTTSKKNSVKSTTSLSASQNLADWGTLRISAYDKKYYNMQSNRLSYSASWNTQVLGSSLTLSINRSENKYTQVTENIMGATVSIPFSIFFRNAPSARLYNSYTQSSRGNNSLTSRVTGSAKDLPLDYSVSQSFDRTTDGRHSRSQAISATYSSPVGQGMLGYSNMNSESQSYQWRWKSAVVAHPYGITLAPNILSESTSAVLVKTEGSAGVKVKNRRDVVTNRKGHAIVPTAQAYRQSNINLDASSFGDYTEILDTQKTVIPTHGALALAEFQTSVGYRVLFAITRNGKPLPFGSTLANDANSIANSDGEIYVSGVKDRQILTVNIGEKSECNVTFDKTQATEHSGLYVLNAQCL